MQSPFPQLMTILLLFHLGLGCCSHHSHACELDSCEFETALMDGCEHHFHSPAATAVVARKVCGMPPVGIAHEGHDSHDCSEEDCTFIADRPRLVSNIEEASRLSSVVVQMLGHAGTVSRDALFASGSICELAFASLPRTHLALQVLQL